MIGRILRVFPLIVPTVFAVGLTAWKGYANSCLQVAFPRLQKIAQIIFAFLLNAGSSQARHGIQAELRAT